MISFFQKKYIKIPIVLLIIFSISFRFFPPPEKAEAIEPSPRPSINYLDICEPKVPFYDEALQTDELQEACYLLKKIQDKAAQIVTIARRMYDSTDPLEECNPWWGDKFPYITEGTCKSACVWGFPEFTVSIDITMLILCAFAPEVCVVIVDTLMKIKTLLDAATLIKWWNIWQKIKFILNLAEIFRDFTDLFQDLDELRQKIKELLELLPEIDTSQAKEFFETLSALMLISYEIQRELTNIGGKVYSMEHTVGVFTGGQLQGIYRLVNEIGDIFATKILAPGQSPDPENGDERPPVEETLEEMGQAADNLTCGSVCDDIENLVDKIIAENDAIQLILYDFYQEGGEDLALAILGMLEVICQTKPKILAILSYLQALEDKISQAPDSDDSASDDLDTISAGVTELRAIFNPLAEKISQLESGEIQEVESCQGRADGASCGDFRWCLGGKCMEHYWQLVGTKHGWCCSGSRTQCTPEQYGNVREGGGFKRFADPKNQYGGIERYVNCGVPFCFFTDIGKYKCERKEVVQVEEPWPPEEACRLHDHLYLLQQLDKIIAMLRATGKKVEAVATTDLESSNEQIEDDCQIIRERLDDIKTELDKIRAALIDFGVSGGDIDEAKAELDEIKPKIDELEEKALQAMGIINLVKAIKLIKDIIDLVKEIIREAKDLMDKINRVLEGEDGDDELEKLKQRLQDILDKLASLEEWQKVKVDVSIDISDLRDGIRCLPAWGIYGEYQAESSEEIPCPMPAWWREETCQTDDDCDEGYLCENEICRKECNNDGDCDEDYICEGGVCIEPKASKYIGGRVCPDLKVPFSQLSGAFVSIKFNLNKIRDIRREGHPEVAPVENKGFQIWERVLYVQSWAIFLRYMTDNCRCGRSYCRLTFGISGISFPGCLDPALNPYCWLGWIWGRNWLRDEANKLENVNSE